MEKKKILNATINKNFLAREVYEILKVKIIEDDIKPGEKINILDIAEELGVSRTPVVSAINDLKNDGFVIVEPQHGTFVKNFSREEIELIYRFREVLEPIIAEIAIDKADKERLRYFKESFLEFNKIESFDYKCLYRLFELELSLHSFLESNLPEILRKDFRNISDLTKRSRLLNLKLEGKTYTADDLKKVNIDMHVNLIDAIIDNNLEAARKFALEDVAFTKENIMKDLYTEKDK